MKVAETFAGAVASAARGRWAEAEQACRAILAVDPCHAASLHLLATAALLKGDLPEAARHAQRAVTVDDTVAAYQVSLGAALRGLGRGAQAARCFERAAMLDPLFPQAHYNLGNARADAGRHAEAIACYERALALAPGFVEAHYNLGNALLAVQRHDEAIARYGAALALKPDFAPAFCNRGHALTCRGRTDEAIGDFERALAIAPRYPEALHNLGNALLEKGRIAEAIARFEAALALAPRYVDARANLGHALAQQGRLGEAVAAYEQAIALDPDRAALHSNLLFCLLHDPDVAPDTCRERHLAFAHRFEEPLKAQWRAHPNRRDPDKRLRVGFVSGDLRRHPVASFIAPVWGALAPAAVEVFAYSTCPVRDATTERLQSLVARWRDAAALDDAALASAIRGDGIDVLVDLSGHTAFHRLLAFARRPAPVQATWIGYPGTTGMESIDYLLCDRFNAPPGLYERYYRERFARLPSAGAFEAAAEAPPVNALPALARGFVTFGSFNRPAKLHEGVVAAWARVLRELPDARLLLAHIDDDATAAALAARFAAHGIARARLAFRPRRAMADYLALHHEVDIALDTWPYSGGTTMQHALWMGVPAVTLRGPSRAHCQGAAALARLGLDDWIADDVDGFVRIALGHARDLPALATLRAGLRERCGTSPWRDPANVARGLEAALRIMWRRWCAGEPPADFEVPAAAMRGEELHA